MKVIIGSEMTKYRIIELSSGLVAKVDPEDYERINKYKWCAAKHRNTWYAQRASNGTTIYMHREILPGFPLIDHEDRDGLNNQKYNLRPCTGTQNQFNANMRINNKSGIRGVSWDSSRGKWTVRIKNGSKYEYLGRFDDIEEAAIIYKDRAIQLYGEFVNVYNADSKETT